MAPLTQIRLMHDIKPVRFDSSEFFRQLRRRLGRQHLLEGREVAEF
jgi:hypothetical protein